MKKIIIAIIVIVLIVPIAAFGACRMLDGDGILQTRPENIGTPSPQPTISTKKHTVQEITIAPTEEPFDAFIGKVKISGITLYEDISIEEIPDEIAIFDFEPIVIDEATANSFIDNLSDNGWDNHEFQRTDENGLYFIGSKERGEGFDNEEEHIEAFEHFMELSGLNAYFEDKGINLRGELVGEKEQYTKFYWLTTDGAETNSYIRINLESDKICGECKMYLCENTVIKKIPSVSFEEALKYAFYAESEIPNDLSEREFRVNNVDIRYINGLPYYDFIAYIVDTRGAVSGYAPAISFDEIMTDEILLQKFMNFED